MKKFSTVLFVLVWFSVSLFGEGNKPQFPPEILSQIPKSYGLLDSAVVAPDKKSFYTLKDGVVTHWQLHPIKKLNSFQSNIHNEQLYISKDTKNHYRYNKFANNKPKLFLNKAKNRFILKSDKVVEYWDMNSNKLVYGAPIAVKYISLSMYNFKNDLLELVTSSSKSNISKVKIGKYKREEKYVSKVSIRSGKHILYNEYLSTDIKLFKHLYTYIPQEKLVNNSLKYIVTFNNSYQEIHSCRYVKIENNNGYIKYDKIETIVSTKELKKYKNRYERVFSATTLNNAMKAMYRTTEGIKNLLTISKPKWYMNDFHSFKINFKFSVELESLAIFIKEMDYPALYITDTVLHYQKKDSYNFDVRLNSSVDICSNGVHLVFMGRGKDGKIYKATNYGIINCTE